MEKKKSQSGVLVDIVKNLNKKDLKIVEIGIWKSHTMKQVLKRSKDVISQYWAVDFWKFTNSWNYRHRTPEFWEGRYFNACRLMRYFPQIHVLRMSSLEAAKIFPKKYFDLVFLDADHTYEALMSDIKAWLPLVKDGGLLTGHDYGGKKVGVKQAVDECFDDIELAQATVWIKKVAWPVDGEVL